MKFRNIEIELFERKYAKQQFLGMVGIFIGVLAAIVIVGLIK